MSHGLDDSLQTVQDYCKAVGLYKYTKEIGETVV